MKRHVCTLVTILLSSGLALGQQSQPLPAPQSQAAHDEHEHLSKKEKKELKKDRERERKEDKKRLKKEAEERKKEDKQRDKELAKQRKHDHDNDRKKEEKEMARQQKEEKEMARQRDEQRKHEAQEARREHDHDRDIDSRHQTAATAEEHGSLAGHAVGAGVGLVKAPFRLARFATPRLLRAQRDVGHAIYTAFPSSNVAVMLTDAGQIVLRGAAPSPDMRVRLLQVAAGAAGGYPIIDQLAADFVGDAASAAASAAVGGVSDLIHGNGNEAPANGEYASSDNGQYALPPSNSPTAPDASAVAALEPGTSACVNVSNTQVLLTGQASSEASAELIRQFARQVGGPSATLNDQLAVRSNGSAAAAPPPQSVPATAGAAADTSPAVTPGSSVCMNVSSVNEVMLSGTVGAPRQMTAVERAAQPLVASARLNDTLTVGNLAGPRGEANAAIASSSNSAASSAGAAAEQPTDQQGTLEQALHAIPRLSGVDATVTADSVHLMGSVGTSQDAQLARDIARQHAPGASVVDQISVAGPSPRP